VRFLETPATVWPAQSVLIDEISRCKPEHQNRLFALIHERRVQGIALGKLRFRWAAMNPPSVGQGSDDDYIGSEPLDPALADRFSLFVTATDWDQLDEEQRRAIARPEGEGRIADDGGVLAEALSDWRSTFNARIDHCPELILDYVTSAASNLLLAGVRGGGVARGALQPAGGGLPGTRGAGGRGPARRRGVASRRTTCTCPYKNSTSI
jgi:MoxR-like ATPase